MQHFAEALSQVTHLHVYPGMTTALQPQFHTTEQQSVSQARNGKHACICLCVMYVLQAIERLREMDDRLTYGQICRVIKEVNSEIRQGRKESIGRKPTEQKVGHGKPRARFPAHACNAVRARMRKSPPTNLYLGACANVDVPFFQLQGSKKPREVS